jgi:flavin-dependent dehydrogenase
MMSSENSSLDSNDNTIKILGAGPSGLAAAINLVKAGYNVTIYEKNADCGMRFRGDFQGLENWSSSTDILEDLQAMNISINFWYKAIRHAEFYDYHLNKRKVNFERPGLYLIRRGAMEGTLDSALKKQALDNGVTIHFKKRIHPSEAHIVAGGPKRVDGIVRGMVFTTNTDHVPILILDDNLAPKSFAYLLIGEGQGCLGTGLLNNFTKADEYLTKTEQVFRQLFDLDIVNPQRFTGYFNFFLPPSYELNGRMIIGENAGFQDYLFAFGLRQAFTSGFLAAQSIIHNQSFDGLVKEKLVPQLKTSVSNRFFYQLMGNRGYSASLRKGRQVTDPVRRMGNQYKPSALKRLVYPLAKITLKVIGE